jgi:hypothetical protein
VWDKQFDTCWTEIIVPICLLLDQLTVSSEENYTVEYFFHLYEKSSKKYAEVGFC